MMMNQLKCVLNVVWPTNATLALRRKMIYATAFLLLLAGKNYGQCVSLTTMGSAVSESFNVLANTGTTNNLFITGWFLSESGGGTRDNDQYGADDGSANTGDIYSYGVAASSERALGALRTSTLVPIFGSCYTNNTGGTINSLSISYTGEQWRLGVAERTDRIDFQYSLNAVNLESGTWVDVDALDFTTPNTSIAGATNGNVSPNRTNVSATITGLSIPNGATFWVRWTDFNASGADDGLAVDDFTLTPQATIPPNYTITTMGGNISITDDAGNGDILSISQDGSNIRFAVTPSSRTYSIDGGPTTTFATPADIPLTGATSITINAEEGNDNINISGFVTNLPSLTINGGKGNDSASFGGDITFEANANLNVDLQNDDATPGTDAIALGSDDNLRLSGTGSVIMTASKTISFNLRASIETTDGSITLEANQQAVSSTGFFSGINLLSGAVVRSVNGDVSLTGKGGTSDDMQYGIQNTGTISTTGTGNILLEGTGGTSGNDNDGVRNEGIISATGSGDIEIIGVSTTSPSSEALGNQPNGSITTSTGDILVRGDIVFLDPASSISAGTNKVSFLPITANRAISLGGNDNFSQLGLDDGELDLVTAGLLVIGSPSSGDITVSAAITRPAATNIQLIGNGDVTIEGGGINTAGGTLLLDPGASPAAVRPTFADIDVTATTLFFGSDLSIVITNTTPGSGYNQLTVVGIVDISGVDLQLSGSYTPAGAETFTIVENDGTDDIIGTFAGLIEGATIANFLGSGLPATISYMGGDGNDVVITVINNILCYADTDEDGYGDPNNSMTFNTTCAIGYVSNNTDCDDDEPTVNPEATEICDGIDNNCDGNIDEGLLTTYYRDMDGDGFGNAAMAQQACSQPVGYVTNNADCDDNDALEFPGQVWYQDADGDDYSDGTSLMQCLRPANHYAASELIATSGDCNDGASAINPGATEVCDGVDNDCDGSTDEGLLTTYYRDMDGDGFGNAAMTQQACSQPSGYVTNNTDCDDGDALEKPGQVWYKDADGDDYSDGTSLMQCLRPANHYAASELIAITGDCNDSNAAINPGATEVCDGIDNDCDGSTDEGLLTTYYRDMDGDGFGNAAMTQQACSQPSGYVTNNTDCDDNDALEKPGQVWYQDADGDDYSDGTSLMQCLRPTNYYLASELMASSGDCNDSNVAINPGATEVCDGIDNDCDGSTDEGMLTTYYRDMDGDGFGDNSNAITACSQPSGYVTNNTDCDDNDALEKPGQVWYQDADGDGYSNGTSLTQCTRPANYYRASELEATSGDCDDNDSTVYPNATEVCDGKDNDCNGQIDDVNGSSSNWQQSTIGTGTGSANFPACMAGLQDTFILNSTGVSSPTSDNIHLVYQQLCGNSQITARVLSVGGGGWAGVIMRESLSTGAKKVVLKTQLSSLIRREIRAMTNGPTNNLQFVRPQHVWLRLTRNGSTLTGYTSVDGQNWSFAFTANISMNPCIYVGLFSESINGVANTTTTFDQVSAMGASSAPLQQQHTGFEESAQNWDIEVYPNPSNGLVNLRLLHPSDEPVAVRVLNTLGEQVMYFPELPAGELQPSLDLTGLPAGVYHLLLETEGQLPLSKRVVLTQQ